VTLPLAQVLAAVLSAHAGSAESPAIQYDVAASPGAADLEIEMALPPGLDPRLIVDPAAIGFVEDVQRWDGAGWTPVLSVAGAPRADCRRTGCRIKYRFHLARAAAAIDDPDTAADRGGALVAPVSTWALRPEHLPDSGLRGRVHVVAPPPLAFVTGLAPVPGAADTYWVALLPGFVSPYSAFGRFDDEKIRIGGATLDLAIASPALDGDRVRLRAWVLSAARAVTAYFGRFPVAWALILAVPQPAGVHGKAMGGGGAAVLLQIAPGANLGDPSVDWQAAHEMVHLAVPEMPRAQIWLTEGVATYVEPLARSLTGELRPASVWRDLMLGLPKGLPGPGDRGLDRTHTWGRTYWGGALFAFLADLEIHRATQGRQSLATGLRGVLAAGGDARSFWSVERFIATFDASIERPILRGLYQRLALQPGKIDLPALWRQLGISLTGGEVTLDDGAPLAPIRRAMIGPASVHVP